MKAGELAILIPLLLWLLLLVLALIFTLLAFVGARRRKNTATVALCLWCALAGASLQSALWASITTENLRFQHRKIARLPQGARASDVNLEPMAALKFLVSLDKLGRRLGYVTIILPLILSIRLVTYARARTERPQDGPPAKEEEERFTIE